MNRNIKEEIMDQYKRGWNAANTDTEEIEDIEIAEIIGGFYHDPPDTPFQRAYLAALKSRFVRMQMELPFPRVFEVAASSNGG